MKEYGWSLDEALKFVRERRAVVRPNKGFMQQLVTYQGILDARYSLLPTHAVVIHTCTRLVATICST